MRREAEENAEADKATREKVEKLNEADAMIFQTESQLKEFGDKLSGGNKANIESALGELKVAYESKDVATIQPALDKINEAWKTASEELYKAQAEGGQGGAQAEPQAAEAGDNVQDVDFEEVK
jgi:molecular chaperone DnaK